MKRDAMPVPDKAPHTRSISVAGALKDAVLAALVAFGLFFFLIGLRSEQNSSGALEVSTRFPQLAMIVGAVFVGAFLRSLVFGRGPIGLDRAIPTGVTRAFASIARFGAPALLIFALLVPALVAGAWGVGSALLFSSLFSGMAGVGYDANAFENGYGDGFADGMEQGQIDGGGFDAGGF